MKTKALYSLASAVLFTLVFASCTNETKELTIEQSQVLKQIVMTTQDFQPEAAGRTLYDITDEAIKCTWATNDTVGVFPDKGGQVYFPMSSGAGTKNATFDGEGWALKDGRTYGAYYPCIGKFYLDRNAVPVSYSGQTQVGNASTVHLGAYDYMVASPTVSEFASARFMFKHLSAMVQLKITVPEPATLNSVKLVTDTKAFAVEGEVDIMTDAPSIKPLTLSKSVKMNLQDVATTEENQVLTFYMMLPPTDLSEQSLKAMIVTDECVEIVALESKNFQAGIAYELSGHIADKNQNGGEDDIVGDGTFKDGVVSLAEAGTMKQLLGDDFLNITSLKVVGPINGDDVYNLRKMSKLTTLNLSEASIVEGGEWYYEYSSSKRFYTSKDVIGDNMFRGCTNLVNVVFPNSVSSIGNNAFSGCSSLTSVVIPDGVTSIGDYAFNGCSSMASVTFGDGVTLIGDYTFSGCKSLISVDIPDNVISIGYKAFNECYFMNSITIGDGVVSIGDYAFYFCYSLDSVTIGDGVASIGDYAFYYCSSLTSIDIPDSVTSIGDYAFNDCYSLTSISIGDGVASIGNFAFDGCSSLVSVYIKDLSAWCNISFSNSNSCSNPLNYGAKLYLNNTELTELIIPSDIKQIKSFAFCGCISLTKITMGASVTSIGGGAFSNCKSLSFVNIGKGVTSIGSNAFSGCSSLTSIDIPESVISIGYYTFGNSALTSIDIPDSVTSIGNSSFSGCESLSSVTIGDGVTSIGNNTFSGCFSLTCIDIPDGVTSIGDSSFYGCKSLNSAIIGDGVTLIGYNSFADCNSLASLTIGKNVTTIDHYAFRNCNSLTKMYCYAIKPPTTNGISFPKYEDKAILYVPSGCSSAYKSSNWGSYFRTIVEME